MFSPPYCAPLLSRPEPRALRVHRKWESSKHSAWSHCLHPFPHPLLTPRAAFPPGLGGFPLLMWRTGPPEASGNLPKERTDKSSQRHSDGWQPQATTSPSSMRGKKKYKVQFPLWITSHLDKAYLDGLLGSPLLAVIHILPEKGGILLILLVPPPELDVDLYRASLRQSQGQVMIHEVHPLRLHH